MGAGATASAGANRDGQDLARDEAERKSKQCYDIASGDDDADDDEFFPRDANQRLGAHTRELQTCGEEQSEEGGSKQVAEEALAKPKQGSQQEVATTAPEEGSAKSKQASQQAVATTAPEQDPEEQQGEEQCPEEQRGEGYCSCCFDPETEAEQQ